MSNEKEIKRLNQSLMEKREIVCSEGQTCDFPEILKKEYKVSGVGLIICLTGSFSFTINGRELEARVGQTLFIPDEVCFHVTGQSDDMEVSILFYQVDHIRDILNNSVFSMRFYSIFLAEPAYVWTTGEEGDLMEYVSLLRGMQEEKDSFFGRNERQLLLLALTHRLCAIYHSYMLKDNRMVTGHKHDIFVRLIRLIDRYYTGQRSVDFYADKLCLSAKYLSTLSKSICGYTVQELVFKSIVRKSISLLESTDMSVQEIADFFNFPNASYFGTFFKKQTGKSPQHYREGKGL